MAYSDKVLDHYENPRNVGKLDADDESVGTGMVGAPACGDVMRLQIKVNADGIIEDAKFKTYGCGSAIASSSLLTEWVKGKNLDEAEQIRNTEIAEELASAAGQDSLLGIGRGCDQSSSQGPPGKAEPLVWVLALQSLQRSMLQGNLVSRGNGLGIRLG